MQILNKACTAVQFWGYYKKDKQMIDGHIKSSNVALDDPKGAEADNSFDRWTI